jgi:hypothetical protein
VETLDLQQVPTTDLTSEAELDLSDAPAAFAGQRAIRGQLKSGSEPEPDAPVPSQTSAPSGNRRASYFTLEKLQFDSPFVLLTDPEPAAPRGDSGRKKHRVSHRNKRP